MAIPSLAMIPSGYKDGKVYSVLPSNGNGDFNFTRASSATRVNKDGLIETVGSGIPRLDYTDSSCPSLLLEPSRTNLITYSEDFSVSNWSKYGAGTGVAPILTSNYAISPDGTLNASRLQFNKGSGTSSGDMSILNDNITVSSGATTSKSVYVKSNTSEEYDIVVYGAADASGTNIKKVRVTSEWQRVDVYKTVSSTTSGITIGLREINVTGLSDTADVLVWGAQIEQGSYPTSYIPTQGSAVTRLADSCIQTPSDGIIGQTEGTVYTEINISNTTAKTMLALDTGSASNFIILDTSSSLSPQIKVRQSSGSFPSIITGNTMNYGVNKIAFCYKSGDYAMYVNGVLSGTSTSTTFPSGIISQISVGANTSYGYLSDIVSDFKLYNTRLSNSELQALTQV